MAAIATGSMLAACAASRHGVASGRTSGGRRTVAVVKGGGAFGGCNRAAAFRTRTRATDGEEGAGSSSSEGELVVQWMCLNYRPWIKSEVRSEETAHHLCVSPLPLSPCRELEKSEGAHKVVKSKVLFFHNFAMM